MSDSVPLDEDESMRRRAFLRDTLTSAGLLIAPGVLDEAARLDPVEWPGTRAARVAELEATVHQHATAFPTTPATVSLPALLRSYVDVREVTHEARSDQISRVHGSMAYLCAFLAANLADQANYDGAHTWYGRGLEHAQQAGDREAAGWIGGRATLMPWYRHETRQTIHDAAFAAAHSPFGQLGSTLGNALAASALARAGDRRNALAALDAAERATERSDETFTAYSFPSYRWHKFASDVHTHLGDVARARYHQRHALAGYPPGAITDPTFVRLDEAQCAARGDPRAGAVHATHTVLGLAPERALPALLDRAEEIADAIGDAGRSETEHLRHAVAHTRLLAAA